MEHIDPYQLTIDPTLDGWSWRVTPPDGPDAAGEAADAPTAQRCAAVAEAVLRSLGRARRRAV
jgi:hypothetical protein